ncbi:putative Ig domain-containing protein [Actinoplanes sp. GCM10030250]|uniref:putative Ig domain-containing protein n=1 Tax=Actinoplanes sp. GCM10030250 TaxID=3273376 RepID=UPI00360C35AD
MRRAGRFVALTTVLCTGLGVTATVLPASAADPTGLITGDVVAITETVSDAGFVHPGVGLSAADLRTAQNQVRAGQQPWASYFGAMAATSFASTTYRASNAKSAAQPDVPLDPAFTAAGMRNRETNDSFGALTQALMWTVTGDEVYRRNAVQALRTWSGMDPNRFVYFPDAHIHTGHPLYQFLMAAEIIRATAPLADATPGTHGGYDVVWSAEDDRRLLTNFANPVVEKFLYSNTTWMNQHNFGLFGRIATAIYADDRAGYAKGVEWFTVNSAYDGYDNGALAPQIPLITADNPHNPYGYDFVQVREMARDQAHGECNIDNYTGLARMLEVQGTRVDPSAGTVSARPDAVSAYDFLGRRLLAGANAFYGFMQGVWVPWADERGDGWNGTTSQAYRGRLFNPVNELYYEYALERGVDVAAEAPWLAELSARQDGPYYYNGTAVANFWAPGDKNPEYWVAFPAALAGTTPPAQPANSDLGFGRWSLPLDDRTEIIDGFARAHVTPQGTTSVVDRIMHDGNGSNGVLVRADGPATLQVLDKEPASPLNPDERKSTVLATVGIPATDGQWRYVTYPEAGSYAHHYHLTGAAGTTVDLGHVRLQAQSTLTPPQFTQVAGTYYLTAGHTSAVDLAATGTGGPVTHTAIGLPPGATFDAGSLSWTPGKRATGRYEVRIVADDGQSIATRTFVIVVSKDRAKTVDAAVADGTDRRAVYTTATRTPFETALHTARKAARTGAGFGTALATLLQTIRDLRLLNPKLGDGTLDYRDGVVTPTVLDAAALRNLTDDDFDTSIGDLRVASFVLDFGTRYRIAPKSFDLQARFTFGNRLQGTNVYGSDDGITWDLLTSREAADTNLWQKINVVSRNKYRYLKFQVDHPGVATDPAYPGLWSFAGLRIHGQRSEVPGTVDTVAVTSPDAVAGRVTAGDTVDVAFTSPTPIRRVSVTVAGQNLPATSTDGRSWTATGALGDLDGGGLLDVTIDHTTAGGRRAATVHAGTFLYGSDERHLIDLRAAQSDPAAQGALMLDANAATFSDVANAVTFDLGAGSAFRLDRLDLLARRDNTGMVRLADLVFQGSNDRTNWTTLTGAKFKTLSWQNLPSLTDGEFRYLRVASSTYVNVAELRIFGDLRLSAGPRWPRRCAPGPRPCG